LPLLYILLLQYRIIMLEVLEQVALLNAEGSPFFYLF